MSEEEDKKGLKKEQLIIAAAVAIGTLLILLWSTISWAFTASFAGLLPESGHWRLAVYCLGIFFWLAIPAWIAWFISVNDDRPYKGSRW